MQVAISELPPTERRSVRTIPLMPNAVSGTNGRQIRIGKRSILRFGSSSNASFSRCFAALRFPSWHSQQARSDRMAADIGNRVHSSSKTFQARSTDPDFRRACANKTVHFATDGSYSDNFLATVPALQCRIRIIHVPGSTYAQFPAGMMRVIGDSSPPSTPDQPCSLDLQHLASLA
jgi:hypothetical protein